MEYELHAISEDLIFVRWLHDPTPMAENAYLSLLEMLLDEACEPLYLIVDVRDGQPTSPRMLRRVAELSQHPYFGGSVSYGHKAHASAHLEAFRRRAVPGHHEDMVETVGHALDYLDRLKPGVTARIDRGGLELLYGYGSVAAH
ncbi:MAG: hypothetical protein K8J31_05055 [Anaerolineae bacterium]|nr:hypothetical protein [Anaerolineae bacterium]